MNANNNLTNSLFSYKLDYEEDGTYYDGNIRNQYWKSNIDGIQRAYQYNYDGASRITVAIYGSTKAGENYALNNVTYDANGNILSLSRNGATNTNYTSFGNVDNLSYTYQTNSNKLLKIQDATIGNPDLGDFRDGTNTNNDYEYWEDGSLKKDKNKKIASITYNYLKLPKTITFDNGRTITTQYDAQGSKLKKIDSNGEPTDYEEDEIYVNGSLYQISHDEGRINAQGQYEYNTTDHLGNLRVSLKDSAGIAVPLQSLFYDPWGLSMKGMQINKNYANFNKHQYNGKELQLETGWNDFGARMYGAAEGRWFVPDPKSERMRRWSPFCAFFNNPLRYTDPDGLEPTPAEAARMAAHVYGDKKDNILIGGWQVSKKDFGLSDKDLNNSATGLKSQVYQRLKADGNLEYTYATAGTEANWKDVGADVKQPLGFSNQYTNAADNAVAISNVLGDMELTFTGHSLGGGEAALNALVTDRKAITFNAAGVGDMTKMAEGNWKTLFKSEKNINAYILLTDPLNNLQNKSPIMPDVNGRRHYLWPKDLPSTYNGHSMDNILKNFGIRQPNDYKK
ncbi:RHS repeat domain-containing protein [Flectobacillus major]|uniref:RHS repeat domain-containing protein n=1 Tax=Flectobacillus major TaxID=103 RepID=UPI000427CD3A|nr:RHS repeat-associated core domain-containing protein [Flectobacillus major]